MKNDKKKETKDWMEAAVREIGLEQPSPDFTQKVLSNLPKQEIEASPVVYRPLITKNGWALVVLIIILILSLPFYLGEGEVSKEKSVFQKALEHLSFDFFSGIHFSDTVVMGTVLFAFFACIQIITLKRFIEKQI